MGIRGAWSLLSKEPSRYGNPWLLRNKTNSAGPLLFLDGPSFLFHVLKTDAYDDDAAEQFPRDPNGVAGTVSPDVVYRRVVYFISLLFKVGGSSLDVHVVMDGVSHFSKIKTQTSRLRSVAIQCEELAASRPRNVTRKPILHIFAEEAMVDALNHAAETHQGLHVHQPMQGEAEAFIAQELNEIQRNTDDVVILSDDTDFLVYQSCPGFVPFKSLQFQQVSGSLRLTGFQYLRIRFLASFLPSEETDERVMATVAALAGCDYVLSSARESMVRRARSFIVQSNMGGLRQRQRNDPSSSAALTAILRFVAHHCKRRKQPRQGTTTGLLGPPQWLVSLGSEVCGQGKGRELRVQCFLEALEQIFRVYVPFSSSPSAVDTELPPLWTAYSRLVQHGVMFCPPVVESWGGFGRLVSRRHTSKRAKCQGRRSDNLVSGVEQSNDDPPSEDVTSVPPSSSTVANWVARGSIWKLPHLCEVRARTYSVLHQRALTASGAYVTGKGFHPTWSSTLPTVTEYLRVGTQRGVDFGERRIVVKGAQEGSKRETHPPTFLLSFCIMGDKLQCSGEIVRTVPKHYKMLFLSSLLLNERNSLLLLLTGTAPLELTPLKLTTSEGNHPAVVQAMGLLATACFHAALALNATLDVAIDTENPARCEYFTWATHRVFRADTTKWIWKKLNDGDDEVDEDPLPKSVTSTHLEPKELVDAFFQHCLKSKATENQTVLQTWQHEVFPLWMKWCELYKASNRSIC